MNMQSRMVSRLCMTALGLALLGGLAACGSGDSDDRVGSSSEPGTGKSTVAELTSCDAMNASDLGRIVGLRETEDVEASAGYYLDNTDSNLLVARLSDGDIAAWITDGARDPENTYSLDEHSAAVSGAPIATEAQRQKALGDRSVESMAGCVE